MKKLILFTLIIAFYFTPDSLTGVFASTIEASISENIVRVGDSVYVNIDLYTEKESINAIEGFIEIKGDAVVESVSTVDSIINLWIDSPKIEGNRVRWGGIIPGGFSGVVSPFYKGVKSGRLLRVAIRPLKEGSVSVFFHEIDLRLNDGAGTQSKVTSKSLSFDVFAKIEGLSAKIPLEQNKDNSEEIFSATITRNNLVADNKWFLIFKDDTSMATVDHYEVAETSSNNPESISKELWHVAESPYILLDQHRNSFVFVKSVRVSGEKLILIRPSFQGSLMSSHAVVGWGIIMLILIFLIRKYFFKKAQ